MELNDSQHTVIELLRIRILTEKYKTVEEVLELIEEVLTNDQI